MSDLDWEFGLPSIGSGEASGGRTGPKAVIPFHWRRAGSSGSGHLTYRVVDGRLECVGVRVGDAGGIPAADWVTSPQPPLTAAVFRALPMGAIIAEGARLVTEQADFLGEVRAALNDSPEIIVDLSDPSTEGSGRTLVPAHIIRRGVGPRDATDPRAAAFLEVLDATDLRITASTRRGGRPPVHGAEHYREVARIYAETWGFGDRHPTATVAARFIVARSTAAKWVSTARRRGFLGPTLPRRAGGIKPRG